MSTGRRSLPQNKANSSFSVSTVGASTSQPQKHSLVKTVSKNSSSFKFTPGSPMPSGKSKNTKSIRLSDLMAAMYPGLKVGHKNCTEKLELVPKTMGWLWNSEDTATGEPFPHGWRPGAIALGVRKKTLRTRLMSEPLYTTPTGFKGKKSKKKPGTADAPSTTKQSKSRTSSIEIDVPPTLCVHKEHGVYHVKMRPIKGNGKDPSAEEPPVQFKIAESVNSCSQETNSSSSSLKLEYLCTGALRKPIVKPEMVEMGTQWDTSDFEKKEIIKEKNVNESKEDKSLKKGKKKI